MTTNTYMRTYFAKYPERRAWVNLKQRCLNQNHPYWAEYGGRGIGVCGGIKDSCDHFVSVVGKKPSSEHSIDRIDNNMGYWCGTCEDCKSQEYPLNLRWADKTTQKRNQRTYANNTSGRRGVSKARKGWVARIGIKGKLVTLGTFKNYTEAVKARELAEQRYFAN